MNENDVNMLKFKWSHKKMTHKFYCMYEKCQLNSTQLNSTSDRSLCKLMRGF